MASRTYTVEVENIPLDNRSSDGADGSEDSSGTGSNSGVPLHRAKSDVQLRERDSWNSTKYHTYNGYDLRTCHSLPSQQRYGLSGGLTLRHHMCETRPTAWYNTMIARRRQGISPNNEAEAVKEIAEAMEADEKLMSDDVDGEMMRRETLRELTKPLRVKKELKRRLTDHCSTHPRKARTISPFKHLKYILSMYRYKLVRSVHDAFHDYSLWHKDLKEIEGTFGSGVGSYFRFLRYLLILNFFITILVCGFLLTPQLLAPSVEVTSSCTNVTLVEEDLVTPAALKVSDDPSGSNMPTIRTSNNIVTASENQDRTFGALDWLTGAGWFDSTALYYGTYLADSFSLIKGLYYNIPEAYFLVIALCYIIYLIVILRRVTILYKTNYIDTKHDVTATFVKKVFSSWDFSITEKKAAALKHRSIYSELKELLEDYLREEEEKSFWERVCSWCVRLFFWTLVLTLLALLGWATLLMLENGISQNVVENTKGSGLGLLIYPLIVTCIITFIPTILALLVKLEPYNSPRDRLVVTLVRTFLLEMTVLGVLVGFWYLEASGPAKLQGKKTDDCWETSLGQEFYRLLIMDFFVTLIMQFATLIFSIATRSQAKGKIHQYLLEFDMSRNTLHLIYNQTLLWAAFFFCPLAPLIVLIKMFITFYIQKSVVVKFLRPNEHPWRAAQTETVFVALTLVSLLLACFGFCFILVRGNTSCACGPFQKYDHYVEFFWALTASDEQTALKIISFFLKPGVVAGILGILLILVYCAKSVAEGRAEMISVLRQQLELEIRDRAFLLQLTEKVLRGEHRRALPVHREGIVSQSPSTSQPQNLPQRAASFVFAGNKAALYEAGYETGNSPAKTEFYIGEVHPEDAQPSPRYFSDYTGESQI